MSTKHGRREQWGDTVKVSKFGVEVNLGVNLCSLFHFPQHYKIWLDTIYSHSPEGATALHCNSAAVLAESAFYEHI